MSITRQILAAIALACVAAPAMAQPSMVKKFDNWGVYSYKDNGKTVCYVLTVPKKMEPASVNHGDNFLLVAPKPGSSRAYAPQAHMGYDLKPKSQVTVKVDDDTFFMTPRGKTAWTQREAREGEFVDAMKAGSTLTIEATSKRGTETRYGFSLAGVTAALKQAEKCN